MVKASILHGKPRSRMRLMASSPTILGMAISMMMTSGLSSWARAMASAPSPASPTTRISVWASSRVRKPARRMGWSSTSKMRTGVASALCGAGDGIGFEWSMRVLQRIVWDGGTNGGASPRRSLYLQGAVQQAHAFFHAEKAQPRPLFAPLAQPRRAQVEATPVIRHAQFNHAVVPAQDNGNSACLGMLGDVGQRFLHHAIDGCRALQWQIEIAFGQLGGDGDARTLGVITRKRPQSGNEAKLIQRGRAQIQREAAHLIDGVGDSGAQFLQRALHRI